MPSEAPTPKEEQGAVEKLSQIVLPSPHGAFEAAVATVLAVLSSSQARIAELEGAPEPVGCAEREVGRYIYKRIEAFMGAEAGTPAAQELAYLSRIVSDVEEYGADEMSPSEIAPEFSGPHAEGYPK